MTAMAELDPSPPARAGHVVRSLSEELLHASDSKLLKVTQMIDRLPDRGEADQLLAPIRGRLAQLRPSRPMTHTRLLFTPLDAVVAAAPKWQPGDLAIPRSLIQPLANLLLPRIPGELPPDLQDADDAALTRAGAPLWSAAAAELATLELPADWRTPDWQKMHGLTAAMVIPLVAPLQVILRHAVTLRSLPPHTDPRCEQVLSALLSDAAETAPLGWGLMLALLLEAAAPDQVVRSAIAVARNHRSVTVLMAGIDQAAADTLGRMEALVEEPGPDDLLDAGRMQARVALIGRIERFRRLELRPAPEQRRLARLRQAVSAANRLVFETTLQARLPGPAAAPRPPQVAACTPPLAAEAVGALEAEARQLRRFALAAGRLGESDEYGRLLEDAASRYLDAGTSSGLLAADSLRLAELLVGSERAIEIMDRR